MQFSAQHIQAELIIFSKQLYFSVIGIIFMIGISFVPRDNCKIILYYLSAFYSIACSSFNYRKKISGSRSWFSMGGFGIQPSEFAKDSDNTALTNFLSQGIEDAFRNVNRFPEFLKACAIVLIPITADNETA
ncbi:MAG: FtsW/RodA/SpoVE family cell cycle protein [Ignavibacteria bacterium]